MKLLLIISVVLIIIAVIATLLTINKPDEDYSKSTARNTSNLTWIYVVSILVSLLALGIYIWTT